MYPSVTAAKSNARAMLKGRWGAGIAVSMTLASVICFYAFTRELLLSVTGASAEAVLSGTLRLDTLAALAIIGAYDFAALCLLLGPLTLGVFRWFWELSAGKALAYSEIFRYFSGERLPGAVNFVSRLALRLIFCAVLAFFPYSLVSVLTSPGLYRLFGRSVPLTLAGLAPLAILLQSAGVVMLVIYVFRLYLLLPLYCEEDGGDFTDLLTRARRLASPAAPGYLLFLLSFLGWLLLSLLGVPILYTLPFFLAANTVYCRFSLNYGNAVLGTPAAA